MSQSNLIDAIRKAKSLLGAPRRIAVGMTMSPTVFTALRQKLETTPKPETQSLFSNLPFGMPILVDPRMNSKTATVYYDKRIWRKRVKDQNRYDRKMFRLQKLTNHTAPTS